MALSIEGIAVSGHWTVEALDWKVQWCAVCDFCHDNLTRHFLFFKRVREMELFHLNPVVHANKEIIVWNKNGSDQWLPEACNWQALFRLLDAKKF